MTDSVKDPLDAERLASANALASANSQITTLTTQVAAQAAQIASLNAQLNALDPWHPIDKTGAADVTDAFQAIVAKGGVVNVPDGTYLIDAGKSIKPVSGSTLNLGNAVLKVKPNGLIRYAAILIDGPSNVAINGGHLMGDRLAHDFTAAGTHEWGMGVDIKATSSNITITDLITEQMTGDGISNGGNNTTLTNVTSQYNRRQGLSIYGVNTCAVNGGNYSNTGDYQGQLGTAPSAGIDIEPDAGAASGIVINGAQINNNKTSGLLLWTRAATGASIAAQALNCTMANNPNGVNCKSLSGLPVTLTLKGNAITRSSGSGVRVDSGSTVTIGTSSLADANTITGMSARTAFDLSGTDTRTKYDINVLTGGTATVGWNHYK